jgi:ABC-type sugar transport system permease subunit
MKDIVKISLKIVLLFLVLFLITRTFKKADEIIVSSNAKAFYSKGNSPDSVRREVIDQLRKFQVGYSERNTGNIDIFMKSLYSGENLLILGTMPSEVFIGFENATRLVKTDWESWGDCHFQIDSASISSLGNTAWFATRGYVEFDLSRLLVLPLRLTGVMVKEDQKWKFSQQQFQFDTDSSLILIAILVISVWILISVIILIVKTIKTYLQPTE